MGKNYDSSKQYLSHNSGQYSGPLNILKRVWVRRAFGIPTSIMMNRYDIIDDLKGAVFQKYPNSIGKTHDSSELRVFVNVQKKEQMSIVKPSKNKSLSRLKNESTEDVSHRNQTHNDINSHKILTPIQPDKNVWDVLEEYFGSDMKMEDAFIIEVPGEQPQPLPSGVHAIENALTKIPNQVRSPSPTQPGIHQQISSTLQTPKPHKPHHSSNSLVAEKCSPGSPKITKEVSPIISAHKRSQSSPSQSPVSLNSQSKANNSQAVLLLPKNFSLGEQNSTKRVSVDEGVGRRVQTSQSDLSPSKSKIHENRPSLGHKEQSLEISEANGDSSMDHEISYVSKDSKSTRSISNSTSNLGEKRRSPIEKTLNTSTFEQVLPSISVLVVEDNSINQAILGAFLRKHKIHYQIAKNGQEAVDKWRKGGFHLVLMDIQLPVKSGIEATKEIRHLEKVNRIGVFAQHELNNSQSTTNLTIKEDQKLDLSTFRSPVIIVALTASSNSSVDKKNALTAGCNDFLTKPVNLVWLQNKITEWGCMQALIDFDGWRGKGN